MKVGSRNRSPKSAAAIFTCRACDGYHLSDGSRASPYQIFRLVNYEHQPEDSTLIVCNAGHVRPYLVEGEAIPVDVGRWDDLPTGFRQPRPRGARS